MPGILNATGKRVLGFENGQTIKGSGYNTVDKHI